MIYITERWSVTRDSYQWVLLESYWTQATEENPLGTLATRRSYHPWLDQVMRYAAQKDCEGAEAFGDIEKRFKALTDAFAAAINKPDRSALELHARCKDLENINADLRKQLRANP